MIGDTRSAADTVAALHVAMERASAALDFETASVLRDRINLLRGGADVATAVRADTSGLTRQRPGAMGIGTNRARPTPPKDWQPPARPDLRKPGKR